MAKKNATEVGKEYVGSKLKSLFAEPEKQAQIDALFSDPRIAAELGADLLRQEDYSRLAQEASRTDAEAKLLYEQNTRWAAERQNDLVEAATIKAFLASKGITDLSQLGEIDNSNNNQQAPVIPKEVTDRLKRLDALESTVQNISTTGWQVMTILPKLVGEHYATYKEPLDTVALIQHCQKTGLSLDRGGYESFTADKAKARADADLDRRLKEAEERGAQKAREQFGSGIPYPTGTDDFGGGTSGIASLLQAPGAVGSEAKEAAALFNQLRSNRSSS